MSDFASEVVAKYPPNPQIAKMGISITKQEAKFRHLYKKSGSPSKNIEDWGELGHFLAFTLKQLYCDK